MSLLDASTIALLEAVAAMARKGSAGDRGGGLRKGVLTGGNEEFADYRPYRQGDDFRRIDWKPYLRFGEPFTKVFAKATSGSAFVLLDLSASMGISPKKAALAKRMAAAVGYLALCLGDRLTLELVRPENTVQVGPLEGKQTVSTLIETLEGAAFSGRVSLDRAVSTSKATAAARPAVVLVSDLFDTGRWAESLRSLSARGSNVSVIQVLDEEEVNPSPKGNVELTDVETGERIVKWLGEEAVSEYRKLFAQRQEELNDLLTAARASLTVVTTTDDLREVLMRL
ncbi:MAG: DUF58 domain-containing protein [Planctomycetota bacterium]